MFISLCGFLYFKTDIKKIFKQQSITENNRNIIMFSFYYSNQNFFSKNLQNLLNKHKQVHVYGDLRINDKIPSSLNKEFD